jgi:hypothetical protein
MTIIMVGLVLVAVGIVWAVVLNVLEGQEEQLDVSQKCLGIIIRPTSVECDGTECTVVVERATGSAGDSVDGVGITVYNDTASEDEEVVSDNVAAIKTVTFNSDVEADKASVRAYFEDAEGNPQFCSQIETYP